MIPFNDLRRQNDPIAAELKAAMDQVVDSGRYILRATRIALMAPSA